MKVIFDVWQSSDCTVKQLEEQYAELSRRPSTTQAQPKHDYTEAVAEAKRLGAEKMLLRAMVQQNSEWMFLIQRALDFEASNLVTRQQPEQTPTVQLDTIDRIQATEEFGFHPLTEQDLAQTILDHKWEIHRVETKLLRSAELDRLTGKKAHRLQAFGWDVVQRVENSVMEFVFTKRFTGLNVRDIMLKTWNNDITLETFNKVKAETCRLQVLQKLNANAYTFVRDITSPSEISVFRSVFVHFLVEATKEFPVLSESGSDASNESLTGTGYVLGTQSVRTDHQLSFLKEHGSDEKMAWADLALTTEVYEVVDPSTGEMYQEVFWAGRTDYSTEEDAQRNAADTLQDLLRWEMHTVAPALTLLK
ncbi:hypothetical protein BBJ29_007877 [Phytophthora kernoviae]|uniref:Uncharacterized protein n=1 Tax=Phytophthora kernoviae TaxID=325452 RepID=A0A3F2RIY4_9STRA|nr:hypothetical protein BBP00_00007148 [Phytophthora kernoviae]RLN59191.1 hypothetical protein BBJ29_007877 [Phytophthora kernoviae]